MTSLGKRLLQSTAEARSIARGEADPSTYRVQIPSDLNVKAIRHATGLKQAEFANAFGFPLATLRDWEQGRARPDTSARAYLLVISRQPKAVQRALQEDMTRRAGSLMPGQ